MQPDNESLRDAAETVRSWVADGTPSTEPVTQETPVATEPVRDASGKFTAEPAADPTTATPTPGSAASVAASAAAPATEYIVGQMEDGTEFQIPKNVRIPLKRDKEITYEPLEDVRKDGMRLRDYQLKSNAVALQKQENEASRTKLEAEQARVAARETWLTEREVEMREAQKDPDKWAAYQDMQRLYAENPTFRKTMDDALDKRETEAELSVYRERDEAAQVTQGISLASTWIETVGAEFPSVNQDRVRQLYAQALSSGRAALDPNHVRAIYQDEARFVESAQTPLRSELQALKDQIAALEGKKQADTHNAGTQHALARAKVPPVATGGNPPAPVGAVQPGKFGPRELVERNAAWARER